MKLIAERCRSQQQEVSVRKSQVGSSSFPLKDSVNQQDSTDSCLIEYKVINDDLENAARLFLTLLENSYA